MAKATSEKTKYWQQAHGRANYYMSDKSLETLLERYTGYLNKLLMIAEIKDYDVNVEAFVRRGIHQPKRESGQTILSVRFKKRDIKKDRRGA